MDFDPFSTLRPSYIHEVTGWKPWRQHSATEYYAFLPRMSRLAEGLSRPQGFG